MYLFQRLVLFMISLMVIIVLYPLIGGVVIHYVTDMTVFDSIYFCCITILTVGYGDIG